jgi:Zn-dependent protease with chaperone function
MLEGRFAQNRNKGEKNEKASKRKLFFSLRVIFSIVTVVLIFILFSLLKNSLRFAFGGTVSTFVVYIIVFLIYFRLINFIMVGYLRGNGILITEKQFPEVYSMIIEIAQKYGMSKIPQVFLIQQGGALNAYAARFVGKNYIAIYSDVFEQIGSKPEILKFILAHEMAHVKERHVQKMFWTGLSLFVPFLAQAYSRACEYTCDSYGYEVAREGARDGLVMLAAGKHLYNKIDVEQYIRDYEKNSTIGVRFVEKLNGYPNLPNRIKYIEKGSF